MSERQRSFGNNVELDVAQPTPEVAEQADSWPGKRTLTEAMSQSSGAALPAELQRSLEASLGADLGGVRVHTDGAAEKAAAGLHAKAFTIGQAVYFNRGYFDPGTATGRQLLAHEVAHTVQQRGATGGGALAVSRPGDAHETQAEAFATTFAKGPGARAAAMTPVSRGVIARALIQRDLLDGGVPAQTPAPLNPREPTPAELQQQAQAALRGARGGGVASVVAMVGQLRGGATPTTRAAIEAAINAELNALEKQALGGGRATTPPTSPTAPAANTPPVPGPQAANASNQNATATANAGGASANDANASANAGGANATAGGANANATAGGANANATAGGANANATAGGANANAGGANANANAGGANANANANASGAEGGPGAQPAEQTAGAGGGGGTTGAQPAAQTGAGGQGQTGAGGGGGTDLQTGGAHGGSGASLAPAADAHVEGGVPTAEAIAAVPNPGGRQLIEQELAFHERWSALNGSGASRAAALAGGLLTNDLAGGVAGGAKQFVMGQGIKLLTSQTALGRIPGVGNIIGGGFAAYNLFAGGGAGIKKYTTEAMHGIGGAFNAQNWRDSPWLTAANLVMGIKAALELVGNVCQILSGLAYAFAAIAALGGLLSVFFPPLAFLLPYIPAALQFGRACGGIATVALAVATGLSPIPPLLRAMHIIFTSNDPIKLVAEEATFHEEAKGAIANYAAARMNHSFDNRMAQAANPSAAPKPFSFYGGLRHEVGEGATTVGQSMGRGSSANTAQALGTSSAELKNARTEAAYGATGRARQLGADYFNPDARAAVNQAGLDQAKETVETRTGEQANRQTRADQRTAAAEANPSGLNQRRAAKADAQLETANNRLETANHNEHMAEARNEIGGRNASAGNMGDVGPAATDRQEELEKGAAQAPRDASANGAYQQLREGSTEVHASRNAEGHVQLPPAPGTLAEVDALDQQIGAAAEAEQALAASAATARRTQQQGSQAAAGLQQSAQGVTQFVAGQQSRGASAVQRVGAQTTDLQSRTAQTSTQAQGTTAQAVGPLAGIASTARTVDGLLGRMPSNKFLDVSGAKRNVHQFVVGMDQITGAGPQQAQQAGAATQVVAQRSQQTQQAAQSNAAGVQQGQQLAGTMNQDSTVARTAAAQAAEVASSSTARATETRSQLEQLRQQRQQKWAALLTWAAQHRAAREQILNAGSGGHH